MMAAKKMNKSPKTLSPDKIDAKIQAILLKILETENEKSLQCSAARELLRMTKNMRRHKLERARFRINARKQKAEIEEMRQVGEEERKTARIQIRRFLADFTAARRAGYIPTHTVASNGEGKPDNPGG